MQTYNVSRLPSMIKIGWDGENLWRPQAFDCSVLLANHPNGVITLWLLPNGETDAFPVALERDGNMAIWTPTSAELVVKMGQLQLMCVDGVAVGKSAVVYYQRSDSLVPGEASETPSWAVQVVQDVNAAASHYPKIENGYWWVWDVTNGIWVNTMVKASGAEIDPADIADAVDDYMDEHPVEVPVQSVNGKTGAVVLDASDVGALPANTPIPPAITVDSALSSSSENPVQNKVVTGALSEKYVKPTTGIPKSDLASDVQTSLGKADTALQQHQSLSGYATETWVNQQIAAIPDELPTVTSTDNGKFLCVVSGAWAAQAVPFQTPRVAMTAQDTTPTLDPNKLYVFPEMASLAITLAAITDNTIVNEYHFVFDSGSTATVLTLPASILQPDGFTVEANMHYEVSIVENCMTAQGWAVSA